MSTVYLARQAHPSRYVAVKVLLQRPGIEREDYSIFLTRFQREADIVAKLEHVNIVPIFEYGEQDQLAYLVMPYISGGSLSQLLAKYGKFTLNQSLHFIQQAAAALDYAHAHNVIHRDLKPSNFLIYPDGRLVLADFGIARIAGRGGELGISTLTLAGEFLGTPAYMSPEMLRSEPTDSRTDIYALGIVLFQMLSGNTPYDLLTPKFQQSLPYNKFSTGYQQEQRDDISFSSITENSNSNVSVVATLQVLGTNSLTKRYHWTSTVLQQSDGTWKIDSANFQAITSVKHSSAIISDKS